MKWLLYRPPYAIVKVADEVSQVQPLALSLSDSLKRYDSGCRQVRTVWYKLYITLSLVLKFCVQMKSLANIPDEIVALQCEVQDHIDKVLWTAKEQNSTDLSVVALSSE